MPKLPRITPRRLLRILVKLGFYVHHQSGSHVNLRNNFKNHIHIVIPVHSRELAPKTLKLILVQAEVTVEEIIDLI